MIANEISGYYNGDLASKNIPSIIQPAREKNSDKKTKMNILIFIIILLLIGILVTVLCLVIPADKTSETSNKDQSIQSTTEVYKISSYSLLNCSDGFVGKNCDTECGVTSTAPNYLKIVGGKEAVRNSWPSVVYVRVKYKATIKINNQDHTISQESACTGTLLDKTTVLTAAHCIIDRISYIHPETNKETYYYVATNTYHPTIASIYTVYLGMHEKPTNLDTGSAIAEVFQHENYDRFNTLNDIAILKLKTEATLDDTVQVACLPPTISNSYPTPVRESYAAGWGTLSSGGNVASKLMDVDLKIYNHIECQNLIRAAEKNWNSQICAGDLNGEKDTCQGDSGGPLYVQDVIGNKSNKFVVSGITSYGIGCATYKIPAIYTRVSHFVEWITNLMDK